MPLRSGCSRDVISANIAELVHHGHPQKQSVRIALDHARKTRTQTDKRLGRCPPQPKAFMRRQR